MINQAPKKQLTHFVGARKKFVYTTHRWGTQTDSRRGRRGRWGISCTGFFPPRQQPPHPKATMIQDPPTQESAQNQSSFFGFGILFWAPRGLMRRTSKLFTRSM